MALETSCRLCSFACDEYKCLYDDNGEPSDAYNVVTKYFEPSLFEGRTGLSINVICVECWRHVSEFYSFQQWILNAQIQDHKYIIKQEQSDETNASDTNNFEIDTKTDCKEHDTVLEDITMLKCSNCEKQFQTDMALENHLKLCHSKIKSNDDEIKTKHYVKDCKVVKIHKEKMYNNPFKCETCLASFSQYGNLRRHVRKKHAAQPLLKWKCKYCNKLFRKKTLLESHKHKLHNNQSSNNSQNTVEEILNNKENNIEDSDVEVAEIYKELSNVEEDLQDTTKTPFNTKFKIKDDTDDEYIELEMSDDLSLAEIRSKMQIQKPALEIVDVKSETDEESSEDISIQDLKSTEFIYDSDNDLEELNNDLKCPRCNQLFKSYIQLKEHFATDHPDERCYINCCHVTLYDPESILEHMQYHKNPNSFKCPECGKCFKGRKGLSSHKLQVHSFSRSTYHLHLCCCKKGIARHEKKLAAGTQLDYDRSVCCQRKKKILEDDELIAKWQKEIPCDICKVNFPYYSLMRTHSYYEHPGEKSYISCCQRKMSRISDALAHIRFHLNPDLYRCKICKGDFSAKNTLTKHMHRAHKDFLPKHKWACDECDKTFEIRQILTRHKNVHHSRKKCD